MQYAKPTLGRNFNITNCSEYIKEVVGDLTRDATSIADKSDISTDDMNRYKNLTVHVKYLENFRTQITAMMEGLMDIHQQATSNVREMIEGAQCTSKNWADITEFEDVKTEISSDQLSGSKEEMLNIQSNPDSRYQKTSGVVECLPASLDIEGIYEMSRGGANWKIPKIREMANIPPAFYFFEGDDMHARGVYICLSPGIVTHIPDVRVIPESTSNSKHRTAACKDGLECQNFECSFAHPGTPYMKLGIGSRCPGNPGFGDKDSYGPDMDSISESDIRMLLLYALTDLFPAVAWLQKHKDPRVGSLEVIRNLHLCEPDRS